MPAHGEWSGDCLLHAEQVTGFLSLQGVTLRACAARPELAKRRPAATAISFRQHGLFTASSPCLFKAEPQIAAHLLSLHTQAITIPLLIWVSLRNCSALVTAPTAKYDHRQ